MRVSLLALGVCGLLLTACGAEYPTADEIGRKLLPSVAEELIQNHGSPRVDGMTSEIQGILQQHPTDDTTYTIEPSDEDGETGIIFFTKHDHQRFLELKMELKTTQDGYMIVGHNT